MLLAVVLVGLSGCSSGNSGGSVDPAARIVELPGAAEEIGFDDIVYAPQLERVLIPARKSGLYLVDPDSTGVTRLDGLGSVDSVDEGAGVLFALDRSEEKITVVDPADGSVLGSVMTSAPPDYVRYVETTRELWVTEPAASPPGVEIFAVPEGAAAAPRRVGFIAVEGGSEGLVTSASSGAAYTHAGSDLVAIDLESRTVTERWETGCAETHGFPRVGEQDGVVLASCADDGKVTLLDLDDGRLLASYEVGGGESLPAYSADADHFYVRSDPGTSIATLEWNGDTLRAVRQVMVPASGHCLIADPGGHYWTCDAEQGQVLRFES